MVLFGAGATAQSVLSNRSNGGYLSIHFGYSWRCFMFQNVSSHFQMGLGLFPWVLPLQQSVRRSSQPHCDSVTQPWQQHRMAECCCHGPCSIPRGSPGWSPCVPHLLGCHQLVWTPDWRIQASASDCADILHLPLSLQHCLWGILWSISCLCFPVSLFGSNCWQEKQGTSRYKFHYHINTSLCCRCAPPQDLCTMGWLLLGLEFAWAAMLGWVWTQPEIFLLDWCHWCWAGVVRCSQWPASGPSSPSLPVIWAVLLESSFTESSSSQPSWKISRNPMANSRRSPRRKRPRNSKRPSYQSLEWVLSNPLYLLWMTSRMESQWVTKKKLQVWSIFTQR